MRKIVGGVFQSFDGVMQAPGGPAEDPTGGFDLGGWSMTLCDDKKGQAMGGLFGAPFELLPGRKTYEIFAAHWPYAGDDNPIAKSFNQTAKYVLSRGDDPLEWRKSHRLKDTAAVKALKATDGPDLLIQGSATPYLPLLAEGLIDRLFVMTFPVVLGKGKRLFGPGTPSFALKLVNHDVSATGVVIAAYEPAGKVPIGNAGLPTPSPAELKRRERMQREG